MMEVKQNAAVDINELLAPSRNNSSDEVDDAVIPDLSDRKLHNLGTCDIIQQNDETENMEVENGDTDMSSIIREVDDDVGLDLNNSTNLELEDALLEDDAVPEVSNTKEVEQALLATDGIFSEKADISNSTTSSNNVRDPGDDLDTLLSKINDIVEDCIGKENLNMVDNTISIDQRIGKKEFKGENSLVDNNLAVEQKEMTDDSNMIEGISEPVIDDIHTDIDLIEKGENLNDKNIPISLDFPMIAPQHSDSGNEVISKKNISDGDECDGSVVETNTKSESVNTQSNSIVSVAEYNLNEEKTEGTINGKTTSNNIEDFGELVTVHPPAISNGDIFSPKPVDSTEMKQILHNVELESAMDKSATATKEKTSTDQSVSSANVSNEESDDEIVFYVDQSSETEKCKEVEKNLDTEVEKTNISTQNQKQTSREENIPEGDNDVVLLLDDDDEDFLQNKKGERNADILVQDQVEQNVLDILSAVAGTETKENNIVIDNSDNARDDFSENSSGKGRKAEKGDIIQTAEETNSNCSSSSNLLQEAKSVKTVVDETNTEEVENEEDEDDGEVELIIGEIKESEVLEKTESAEIAPPAKRIRLSEDDDQELKKHALCDRSEQAESLIVIENKKESPVNLNDEKSSVPINSSLKRSHDVIEVEGGEKSDDSKEGITKKPKTDVLTGDAELLGKVEEIIDDKKSENIKYVKDDTNNIKAVPSFDPIRLYPAPEFKVLNSKLPMRLDFLKKFRKSFDNLTKQDLEELVLQKVVEAIIHRSEFAEMRELIEKQEKLINAHRTKISELSKQFRDLEMVHNRVVKDIEQRNSQFIMPVKITRAVGLQVYIPNKKNLAETTLSTGGTNIPSSPQRSTTSQSSSTSSTSLTPAQRQYLSSQTEVQQRAIAQTSGGLANTSNIRRGCVQKITPIRPVPGSSQATSVGPTGVVASTCYRNTSSHSTSTQPRILNKNATNTSNSTAIQRARYLATNPDGQRLQTQQISRTPIASSNSQRVAANSAVQSKPTSNVVTTVPRRSEPLPPQSASSSSSIVDNYINTLTHLTGGNTAVSITPAKPKEKAVIDLTDEDESSGTQTAPQISNSQLPRRSLPAQSSSASQLQYGRAAQPLARVSPANQLASNKNRQMTSLQGQKNNSFTSINTPPGTSITRINVAPSTTNVQRVKYSHPAPLPATPPQAFNPSWKLPPPRPTIRISNLDNGIVISWTMEEAMDRHAECVSYQIYAYQETSGPPMVDSWRHVGDVKAMLLPMAVTLTQFQEGQRYYFAVRAVDCHQRYGPFSLPKTWS